MIFGLTCVSVGLHPATAEARSVSGKLAGVVNDTAGIPQMGAAVEVTAESTGMRSLSFLTDTRGVFRGNQLTPGLYSVRVTLAGFLPTLRQHVRISADVTTIVRIQLESMFASLDQLRHQPSATAVQSDDWKWVLRSAANTRPVLEWAAEDPLTVPAEFPQHPRMRLEFTDGTGQPVSASALPSVPATAVAYEQNLSGSGRLVVAGQMNHDGTIGSGGFAALWLPTDSLTSGAHSTVVFRQASIGPDGPKFRGVRLDQSGSLAFGQRSALHYGAEYVVVGLVQSARSLRPHFAFDTRISDEWQASLIFAANSASPAPLTSDGADSSDRLVTALNELDSFPALLWRDGRPVLADGWHEELAAERKMPARGKLEVAAFHDDHHHTALFGQGAGLPIGEYFGNYLSSAFAYDGGSSSSWGARLALSQRLGDVLQLTTVYSFGGVLTPMSLVNGPLRSMLRTTMRNALGANLSAGRPQWGTRITAGYKWVSGGPVVSRVDAFGESRYQMDPFLHIAVRQALPNFVPGHWEALAGCDNLLAQGYVSSRSADGRAVLAPAFRTFRGGVSLQF